MSIERRRYIERGALYFPIPCIVVKGVDSQAYFRTGINAFNFDNFKIEYDFLLRKPTPLDDQGVIATLANVSSQESWIQASQNLRVRVLGLNLTISGHTFYDTRSVVTLERVNGTFNVYIDGVFQTSAATTAKYNDEIVFPRRSIPRTVYIYNFKIYNNDGELILNAKPFRKSGKYYLINVITNEIVYHTGEIYGEE